MATEKPPTGVRSLRSPGPCRPPELAWRAMAAEKPPTEDRSRRSPAGSSGSVSKQGSLPRREDPSRTRRPSAAASSRAGRAPNPQGSADPPPVRPPVSSRVRHLASRDRTRRRPSKSRAGRCETSQPGSRSVPPIGRARTRSSLAACARRAHWQQPESRLGASSADPRASPARAAIRS